MTDIRIHIDQDRLGDLVTVDEYLGMRDNDERIIISVLSRFVIDENGQYIAEKDARKLIGKMTLNQMREAAGSFFDGAKDAVLPPSNWGG